jgi:ectoine hydroxylase-related dioxygenase (phytanoyl-CoA dioxygenase family)
MEIASMWNGLVKRDGFAVVPGVAPEGDIARVLRDLAENPLPRSRAGSRHALRHPSIVELARGPRLIGLAEEIMGSEAIPFRATLFDKSPRSNWLVAWHQDTALPLRERQDVIGWGPWSVKEGLTYAHAPASVLREVVALRLHFDDSTLGNGLLRVLPGTHNLDVLDGSVIHKLAAETPAFDCVVPMGGVVAMRPLIVHSSSKSRTEHPRRVLHIEYAPSLALQDGLELAIA